ncbi:MAG: response regulator [Elusimicrobia bacterium]|nr:response regulator [Elusimicrobiota bacterium]
MIEKTINGLLIEDDPDDTMLLISLMAQSDWPAFKFIFSCAGDLKTGLQCLAQGGIEVVLLDLMLPDSQGVETVLTVRARAPGVPIVVLTGLSDEELGLKAVMHGAQDYQVKGSIDGHALKRTISYAVERHRLLASLNNIIESAPDGMVIVDSQGMVQHVNPAAELLFGRKGEQLLGKPFPYPMPNAPSGELKIPQETAGTRIVEARISAIEWRDQPAKLASMRDITELRRIEQFKAEILESRKLDKLKDELMSNVSHEMRSPLTIIKAIAGNLREGLAGPMPDPRANNLILTQSVVRLENIVDQILDLSRLESGKAKIHSRRVDVARLIRETVAGLRLVAAPRDILIQANIPDGLPAVCGDPELFVQVLSNLVDNALRFAKTRIIIRASSVEAAPIQEAAPKNADAGQNAAAPASRNCVQVSVIDDGAGVPPGNIGDIFDKFVQVKRHSMGAGYKGTGLGLAICKEIIERQKGKIWAESALGQGARFHFLLPQYAPRSAGRQGGGSMTENEEKPKILMVEDDSDFQAVVRGWISKRYDHIGLPHGGDLMEELESIEPDLVILDVRMPGPDGFKLCSRIRADRRFAHIPILFLTGCKDDEDFIKNLNVGGTAYLTKPVARKRLLSALNELAPA